MTPMERITCPCGKRESLEKAVNIAGYLRCQECQDKIKNEKKKLTIKPYKQ